MHVELWCGSIPTVKYFKIFGSKCLIRMEKDNAKFEEGIFLGYSSWIRAYQCYSNRLGRIMESTNVKVIENIQENSVSTNKSLHIEKQ